MNSARSSVLGRWRRPDALRGEQQPNVQRAVVADHLVVEGDQDQRPEQRDHEQEVEGSGGGEAAAAQQRDIDQRVLAPPAARP
jgi:protein involved in temperature-dependent protein secretion